MNARPSRDPWSPLSNARAAARARPDGRVAAYPRVLPAPTRKPGSPVSAAKHYPREARRHAAAVRRSLRWADGAAERGDWAEALGWVQVIEACGDELPEEFRAKRDRWLLALSQQRLSGRPADPPSEEQRDERGPA